MASSRNNTNPGNSSAESNGGFKTVAFGFDKNDVTMYIASLRKKMKSMEEEFELKLSQALENPTASNEALKHEREVIRAEMEKMWGDKLNERNNILKQQQARINELEAQAADDKDTIASLKAQLTAATSENNTDGAISARAARAYMQFTAELRSISDSVNKTLMQIHNSWSGDFGKQAEEMAQLEMQAVQEAAPASSPSAPSAAPTPAPTASATPAAATAPAPYMTSDPFEDEEEDPLAGLIADIDAEVETAPSNDYADIDSSLLAGDDDVAEKTAADINADMGIDESLLAEPIKEAPELKKGKKEKPARNAAPKAEPVKPEPKASKPEPVKPVAVKEEPAKAEEKSIEEVDFDLLIEEPKPEPAVENAIDSDISSLLSDNSLKDNELIISTPVPAAKAPTAKAPAAQPKIETDDDLSLLLADDDTDNVTAIDNSVGEDDDFADLLAELDKPVDKGEDLVLDTVEPKIDKGVDLDVDILSNMVINPDVVEKTSSDLGSMLGGQDDDFAQFGDLFVTPTDENRSDGLGISADNIDFGADSADELAEKAKEKANKAKKEEDPFDFSFLAAESDDEDDMSTDVSFGGMM